MIQKSIKSNPISMYIDIYQSNQLIYEFLSTFAFNGQNYYKDFAIVTSRNISKATTRKKKIFQEN